MQPGNTETPVRILAACEYSGTVRDAFSAIGHDAWSCDLLPSETPGNHHQGDVRELLAQPWDIIVAFPPCTHLCSSGMHWTVRGKRDPQLTEDALDFVRCLLAAPAKHIALENPVGAISTRIRKPDCILHPWQFGHPESKTTCLWLKNLPALVRQTSCQSPPAGIGKTNAPTDHKTNWGQVPTDGSSGQRRIAAWPKQWRHSGARSYCLRRRLQTLP